MRVTKHHGWGNDFLVTFVAEEPAGAPDIARALCDRHRGIGADGLILGLPGVDEDGTVATFVLLNADGSRAEVSGNGLRCFGQALAGRDLATGPATFDIGTAAGVRQVSVSPTEDSNVVDAAVEMGEIRALPEVEAVTLADALGHQAWTRLAADRWVRVDIGNPHVVIGVADLAGVDIAQVGTAIESALGPTNVHLVAPGAHVGEVRMVIWERGAGLTMACGSGACVVAHTARRWGWAADEVSVSMPGGTASVRLTGDHATLIGPAQFIATIETPDA